MSSRAASAIWPHLARAEDQRRQTDLRTKSNNSIGLPDWAKTNDPIWSKPEPVPAVDYSRVPTLRRVKP